MNDVLDRKHKDSLASEDWRARVLRSVAGRLDQMVSSRELTDFSADSEHAVVNAIADAVKTTNRINDRLGAFYTTDRVRKVLGGVSRQAVSQRVQGHRLLRVTTADGENLFPAVQFKGRDVVPGLQELLKVLLDSGVDGWTVIYWLTARIGQLGEATALDVLSSGDTDRIAELKALATDDAASWLAAA